MKFYAMVLGQGTVDNRKASGVGGLGVGKNVAFEIRNNYPKLKVF